MCDLSAVYGVALGGEIAILAAMALCAVAIGINLSVVGSPAAPVVFGLSLASALLAALAFAPVTAMLATCSTSQCGAQLTDTSLAFGMVTLALASAIAAAYIAGPGSGIAIIGAGPMAFYAVLLAGAAGLLVAAVSSLRTFESCQAQPPEPLSTPVYALAVLAAFLGAIGVAALLLVGSRPEKPKGPHY